MEKLSIIIPARNEKYLDVTVKDLLDKAKGDIEIIIVLNGQTEPYIELYDERVSYIDGPTGMKYAINTGVNASSGKYIMKIDAHCIVAEGFDLQLIKDHQDNWIQIPRRYRLDEDNWKPDFEGIIDYEYWIWPPKYKYTLHGYKWKDRTAERKDIMIDDTLTFQGSFWFMTRDWWNERDFMNDEGFNMLHAQEAAYIGTETWYAGGRVVVNKNTWYSHLHKKKGTRGYHMETGPQRECYAYSYEHFVNENKEKFIKLIDRLSPIPNWPENWKEKLWKN